VYEEPRRIWWARPRKLCAMERPGGGGRSHRAALRESAIDHLLARRVWLVISTMRSRHNLADYERAGLAWHHVPVDSCAEGAGALEELLVVLARETASSGAIAIHGDARTDFVAAVCAAHLHAARGIEPALALAAAGAAGLSVTQEAAGLLGVDYEAVQPRSRIAASTSSGRSVTT